MFAVIRDALFAVFKVLFEWLKGWFLVMICGPVSWFIWTFRDWLWDRLIAILGCILVFLDPLVVPFLSLLPDPYDPWLIHSMQLVRWSSSWCPVETMAIVGMLLLGVRLFVLLLHAGLAIVEGVRKVIELVPMAE